MDCPSHPRRAPPLTPQDAAYHCTAALFYLSASVLEALATIQMYEGYTYRQYHENISAVVSPPASAFAAPLPRPPHRPPFYCFSSLTLNELHLPLLSEEAKPGEGQRWPKAHLAISQARAGPGLAQGCVPGLHGGQVGET